MKPFFIFLSGIFLLFSCTNNDGKTAIPQYSEKDMSSASSKITMQDLQTMGYSMDTIRLISNQDIHNQPGISDVVDLEISEGGIFLMTADSKVMKFSPDGVFETCIGTKGDGPGEYNYINDIYLSSDGKNICLNDVMKGSVTYGIDGKYVETQELETPGQICTSISDGNYIIKSVQVLTGNEADRLFIKDSNGNVTGRFQNHLLFEYSPKANVTAYQEYKALFRNGAGEIVYHQMSTDTIFTVRPEKPALEPRCCFVLQNGAKQKDLTEFADIAQKISLVYDYAEDAMFRFVTLIEPGWTKQLYVINKNDNNIYRSAITVPGIETPFFPKWQSGDKLIDFCHSENGGAYLVILEK